MIATAKVIRINNCKTEQEAQEIAELLQNTVNVVDTESLKKLLRKVKENPSIVKKVMPFI